MLADHTVIHTLLQWVPLAVAAVLGLGWLMGSFQRGRKDATKDIVDIAQKELDILKASRDRLEEEFKSVSSKCKEDLARLDGMVLQLREENAELRKLVMLEKLPPPLAEALKGLAEQFGQMAKDINRETVNALVAHFDQQLDSNRLFWQEKVTDALHPIQTGLDRLLTKGDR